MASPLRSRRSSATPRLACASAFRGSPAAAEAEHADALAFARERHLNITLHASEPPDLELIHDAIVQGAHRIGHGVRAIEDAALVERLAAEKIALEVCPASNIALGVYPTFKAHPLARASTEMATLRRIDPENCNPGASASL